MHCLNNENFFFKFYCESLSCSTPQISPVILLTVSESVTVHVLVGIIPYYCKLFSKQFHFHFLFDVYLLFIIWSTIHKFFIFYLMGSCRRWHWKTLSFCFMLQSHKHVSLLQKNIPVGQHVLIQYLSLISTGVFFLNRNSYHNLWRSSLLFPLSSPACHFLP